MAIIQLVWLPEDVTAENTSNLDEDLLLLHWPMLFALQYSVSVASRRDYLIFHQNILKVRTNIMHVHK